MSWDYDEMKKEIDNYFNNITREQLIKDLRDAGFDVEEVNGSGKVIFTDDE